MEMKMLILLFGVCIFGSSEGMKPCISATGSEWEKYNGHWYFHFTEKLSWIGAQLYCRRQDGNLVHIDDAQENNWLSSKYTTGSIWIGATDLAGEGIWRSITTGKNISYTNWSTSNPDNYNANQHCAILNWGGNGRWDDNTCSREFTFICEVAG